MYRYKLNIVYRGKCISNAPNAAWHVWIFDNKVVSLIRRKNAKSNLMFQLGRSVQTLLYLVFFVNVATPLAQNFYYFDMAVS